MSGSIVGGAYKRVFCRISTRKGVGSIGKDTIRREKRMCGDVCIYLELDGISTCSNERYINPFEKTGGWWW
jgi:hypothetical protein